MNKVSIIIPVYNMERYLVQCLDSIVNQTYSNLEVILINDGSMDTSGVICDEYAERCNFIRAYHKKNEGLCSARNFGLDKITGEWVLFVDSDDWCAIDYVENMMKAARGGGGRYIVICLQSKKRWQF